MLFLIVAAVYLAANIYFFRRLWQTEFQITKKVPLMLIGIILSLGFFLHHAIEQYISLEANHIIYWVTTNWLVVFMYSIFIMLLFDIARYVATKVKGTKPEYRFEHMLSCIALGVIIVIVGNRNASKVVVTEYDTPHASLPVGDTLRIALLSDMHLGYNLSGNHVRASVNIINDEKPDIVLICGDIFDGPYEPVFIDRMLNEYSNLSAPLGAFAVTGNHEYMGNLDPKCALIRQAGIKLLRDTAVNITSTIRLIGREDISCERAFDRKRTPLSELVSDTMCCIVMDHRPRDIREASEQHVALNLSGHTHAGQVWPINYLCELIYPLAYGHRLFNETHAIVTSGFGTWGPRVRIGNSPEVCIITLHH